MFFLLVYTGHISIIWLYRDWSKFSLFFFYETEPYVTIIYANSAQTHGKNNLHKEIDGKILSQLIRAGTELHS